VLPSRFVNLLQGRVLPARMRTCFCKVSGELVSDVEVVAAFCFVWHTSNQIMAS
jgi:hypothetical protein